MLAKNGLSGPYDIFDGKFGFCNQVSGNFELDIDSFGPKTDFMITKTDIKYFQAEYHAQSAIQAALQLRRNAPVKGLLERKEIEGIDKIIITTFEAAKSIIADAQKWHPKTRETANHSMPYLVAVALIDGEVGPQQFTDERISDPLLNNLMQKISVEEDANLTALYPATIPNVVKLVLKDGASFEERVDTPKGHSKNPMTDNEIIEKFYALTKRIVPREAVDKIVSSIWRLDELRDVTDLHFNHVIRT